MKIKVTVELEEGVKSTRVGVMSGEFLFTLLSQGLEKDATKHLVCTDVFKELEKLTKSVASSALRDIAWTIQKYGRLYQYTEDSVRKIHQIVDVNEFQELKKKIEEQE